MAVSRGPCVQVTSSALKWIAFAWVLSSMLACNHPEERPVPLTPRLEWFVKRPGLWVPHAIPAFRNPPWSSQEQEAARQYICSHPDSTSYHMALTLFSDWPKVYARIPDETKMKVLCDRLRQVYYAHDWTLLKATGPKDYIAAMALIELGPRVIPLLTPLLDDNQAIRWEGDHKMEIVEVPRRADLAYRYIMILRDQDPLYDVSVLQRDVWIRQLKQELKDKSSFTTESKDRVNRTSRLRPGG